jgi:glycine cleavage system H lipoate-binding protein
MTALLVIATLVVLLTLDWLWARRTSQAVAEQPAAEPASAPHLVRAAAAGGFELPENLAYHPAHTWAMQESPGLVRVGMDDFAARLLGDPHRIDLPRRGQWVRQGQRLCLVHRDGGAVELLSPMEGIVTDVNDAVAGTPAASTRDPYGKGWLITVQAPDLVTAFRNLLKGTAARSWMEEAAERLRGRLPALAGAVAQDGGVPVRDLAAQLPEETWKSVAREFLGNA